MYEAIAGREFGFYRFKMMLTVVLDDYKEGGVTATRKRKARYSTQSFHWPPGSGTGRESLLVYFLSAHVPE